MPRTVTVRQSLATTIEELQRRINRFESEQGRTTRAMIAAVEAGEYETVELGEWLTISQRLDRLVRHRAPVGNTDGTLTTTTKTSITSILKPSLSPV